MATKGCNKLPTIFDLNKSLQDIIEEVNKKNICLFDILPVVKSGLLVPLLMKLLSYYDHKKNLFDINGHKLTVTLEDILYITGLPIRGKPIMNAPKDKGAFERVFGIVHKNPGSIMRLKDLAGNTNLETDTRVKAALLVLIACFVIPTGDKHKITGDFVKFVERLEDVDNYAWGAALLAFLYDGICKWKVDKHVINGNLWVVLAFFLIRIPELGAAIGIDLNLDEQQVPLLLPVVEVISKISYNHKPTYLSKVEKILDTLTADKIRWKPYELDLHRPILRAHKMYKLLLAPICCMSAVHYHTPHYVHKQFEELEVVDVNQIMWELPKRKENRGPTAQKFLSDFELQQWNEGRRVINYLQGHEVGGMVDQHVENIMDNQPDASNSRDVDSLVHVVDQPETCMVDQLGRHVEPETSIHADTQSDPHQESSILSRRSLLGGDNNEDEDEGRIEDQSEDMAATGSSYAISKVYKRRIKSNTEKEKNTKKKMKTNENDMVEVEHSVYLPKELPSNILTRLENILLSIYSRSDSFITHRAVCDALAEENAKSQNQAVGKANSESDSKVLTGDSLPAAPTPAAITTPQSNNGGGNNEDEDEGRIEDQSEDMAATGSSYATSKVYKRRIKSNTEKEENTKKKMKTNENDKVEVEHSVYLPKELPSNILTRLENILLSIYSRSDSFITHRAVCVALAEENAKSQNQAVGKANSESNSKVLTGDSLPVAPTPAAITTTQSNNGVSSVLETRKLDLQENPPQIIEEPEAIVSTTSVAAALNANCFTGLESCHLQLQLGQQDSLHWGLGQVEPEGSGLGPAGHGLGLPCNGDSGLKELMLGTPSMFGPKQTTLDFLGLGIAAGGSVGGGLSALITSIGGSGGLDVTTATASVGNGEFSGKDIVRNS